MALFGAILSGMKKKDEEEKKLAPLPAPAPAPIAAPSAQLASPRPAGGGIFNKASTAWKNFWQPSPDGVRVRDVVREIPGAAFQVGTQYFTQPVGRGIQTLVNSAERAIGAGDGVTTPQEIVEAVPNKTARDIIYGDQPITSLQEITERRSPDVASAMKWAGINAQVSDKTAPLITFIGATGLTAADALPGDPTDLIKGGSKAGGKEVLERVAINSVDELAPYLKSLLPKFKGNLDKALAKASTALDIPESVINELKSGKVIDTDNFVFQFNKNNGNFIANFEKKFKALPLPEIKQTVEEIAKPVVETTTKATKGVDIKRLQKEWDEALMADNYSTMNRIEDELKTLGYKIKGGEVTKIKGVEPQEIKKVADTAKDSTRLFERPLFHGGGEVDLENVKNLSVTTDKEVAERFLSEKKNIPGQDKLSQFILDSKAKILETKDIPEELFYTPKHKSDYIEGKITLANALKSDVNFPNEGFDITLPQWARENGYDAINLLDNGESEIRILNPKVIKKIEDVAKATDEVVDKTKSFAEDITSRKKFSALTDEAADVLDEIANDPKFKELVERTKGAPVTADEVRQAALNIQDTLGKATTRSQTVEDIAKSTNSFDMADKLMTEGGDANLIAKYLNEGLSFLTDAARKLQSGNQTTRPDSIVGDPIIKEIYQRTGNITAEIVERYKAVDKTNPQAVRDFYYTYAKPSLVEVLDEYRYINILSSIETHKGNIRANFIDSVITEPGTKLMRGFVDQVKSVITKQPRQHFSREAAAYYKGFFSAGKEAVDSVKAVMQGNRFIGNPDLKDMPIGKYAQPTLEEAFRGIRLPGAEGASKLTAQGLEVGTNVNKALEAMDVFFTTLIKNGEQAAQAYRQSRGVELTQEFIEAESKRVAEEVALRTALDPTNKTGQGIVATGIDQIASWLGQNRNSPYPTISTMAKVIFPFLRTTANYLTRFVEYTPGLGMVNAIGRKNVDELIARQVFGSTILAGTLMYAFRAGAEDNLTWSAPTNEREKTLFYDSGRRPFAIKLGDAWIPFQQLGMIGAPFALSAALKHHLDQEKTVSEPMIQSVAKAYGEMLTYFGNLSFAQSFGNIGDALKGEKNAVLKLINEPFRQVTPGAGFLGWAGAMIDTAYRTSTPINQYSPTGVVLAAFAPTLKNLPFLSFLYEPYRKTTGEISRINHPYLNALSPIKFSMENELFDFIYQRVRLEGQLNKLKRDFEEGRINAGGVERGVNNVLDNFVRFVGGDPSQMGDFTLPEQVERGFRIPKEEPTPINLTPEQEKQLAATLPQIKKEMLEAITRTRAAIASKPGRGVSVRASARKVSAPKLSGVGRGVALKASTPTRSSTRGVALRSPFVTDTTSLGASMPELPRLG